MNYCGHVIRSGSHFPQKYEIESELGDLDCGLRGKLKS